MSTTKSKSAAHELERHFAANGYAHVSNLVLEPYGESYAYFRPRPAIDDEPRYVLTQRGRDDLRRAEALERLFGPWPKVSEA
jgi:hypothetical protein